MSVRVRFAPSPTGYLHIGGLRTALYNFLFARHNGGKFILRIEDTDQSRMVKDAASDLIKTLNYMGLTYDEGPDVGGDYGPYYQSQRLDLYKEYCGKLIENDFAYYAFDTPEELEEMRNKQLQSGQNTMYDRRHRNLTPDEVKDKIASGLSYVIRLKVPLDEEIKFTDVIRGHVKIDSNMIDDQILLKSDGYPTYHLANVIDDHLMNITHIIRGEEWLTSVPKHILLYRALGWKTPEMAHVPLILNPDRSKLSKRQGDVATEDFLKKGYLKEALINFIALLGWHPGEGIEENIFGIDELIKLFSLERVHNSGAVFNLDKLNWMNQEYIKRYKDEDYIKLALPYLRNSSFDISDSMKAERVLMVIRPYLNKLDEIPERVSVYYNEINYTDEIRAELANVDSRRVLELLRTKLNYLDIITKDNFKPVLNQIQKETGIKGKGLYHPVRLSLTGQTEGPDLGLTAYILGKKDVLGRLNAILEA